MFGNSKNRKLSTQEKSYISKNGLAFGNRTADFVASCMDFAGRAFSLYLSLWESYERQVESGPNCAGGKLLESLSDEDPVFGLFRSQEPEVFNN